ncbi:MAG: MerR family transcriptional regulator [Rubritepida sp.]|jgi:DNA-binding transcriptional MerR regulator|nr:MerR family transcriptional regulator [Rubritepida sp.]MCU0943819.1 MerR family transcriptional regulator [Rubritepida sp.]
MSEAGPEGAGRPRLQKSAQAFRTISEASEELNVPQHVLRFWETKFPRLKPLKRGGGRRYYRPDDLALLRRIADLLYTQGYTIKGVQRVLDEGEPELPLLPEPNGEDEAVGEALEELERIAAALRALARGG